MTSNGGAVLGWDIGGVNTKAARVEVPPGGPGGLRSASEPYELQRDPGRLVSVLRELARRLGRDGSEVHGVTMTAELSQLFRTKHEGVGFVLDALESAFPDDPIMVYAVDGTYVAPDEARRRPMEVAASNWAATATLVAGFEPNALVIDTGSTTTDIIPISDGRVRAAGLTDLARLASGELIYTGAVRTPVEALVEALPTPEGTAGVSAEGFALIGDALLWLGRLEPEAYTAPTPDGRPATREFSGERLARLVCADREMLDEGAIDRLAKAIAEAQLNKILAGLTAVHARWPSVTRAVVAGIGDFIAAEAARRAGLTVISLGDRLGSAASFAPAAAVAWLLAAQSPSRVS